MAVYGIPWDVCQAVMQRSMWYEQQGQPATWHSQDPSSCANETYYPFTTYSTTEMLTAGEHTLWHGVLAMQSVAASYTGWIKCVHPRPLPHDDFEDLSRRPAGLMA